LTEIPFSIPRREPKSAHCPSALIAVSHRKTGKYRRQPVRHRNGAQRVPLGKPENLRMFSETVNGEFRKFEEERRKAQMAFLESKCAA
jgi:hypothetical protein